MCKKTKSLCVYSDKSLTSFFNGKAEQLMNTVTKVCKFTTVADFACTVICCAVTQALKQCLQGLIYVSDC